MRLLVLSAFVLSLAACAPANAQSAPAPGAVVAVLPDDDSTAKPIRDARRDDQSEAAPAEAAASVEPALSVALPSSAAPRIMAPQAWSCGAEAFCYARLQITGPIVPYTDCSGRSDVGTQIRSLECVSHNYLAGHGYTQFGRITAWRIGDVVYVRGARFVVYSAFTQNGCTKPARALAPLSLQTSLTPVMCGPILVVQARPA